MSKKLFDSAFWTLLTFSGLFFLWQVILFIMARSDTLNLMFNLSAHHLVLPLSVFGAFFFFWVAQVSLYVFFTLLVWRISDEMRLFHRLSPSAYLKCGLIFWGLGAASILLANQMLFPMSIFTHWLTFLVPKAVSNGCFYVCFSLFSAGALYAASLWLYRMYGNHKKWISGISTVSLIVVGVGASSHWLFPASIEHSAKPNIIMIGMDALRPDRLSYYGYPLTQTPTIDAFLSQSVRVEEAITPLARTFPSWTAMLTGQNPLTSGVRDNLVDLSHVNLDHSLPSLLRKAGYETIYATDQTRFSNITTQFGFDRVIATQPGANDFLLGDLNDFPLANVVMNSFLGRWLFPYNYANEGAVLTYQPKTFVSELMRQLDLSHRRPIFLAMHLCLTHFPYLWSESTNPRDSYTHLYDLSVSAVDAQLKQILDGLEARGYLDHAVVILLSDHGEAFSLAGDRSIEKRGYVRGAHQHPHLLKVLSPLDAKEGFEQFDVSVGHGTDVLSYPQYRIFLAIKGYGDHLLFPPRTVKGLASAIDLKPTLLDLVGVPDYASDGISLKRQLQAKEATIPDRPLFAEIGFTPSSIRSNHMVIRDVVYQAMDIFYIDQATGKMVFRPDMLSRELATRQRAVYFKEWILAAYPTLDLKGWVPVLANRHTHQWTDDFMTDFARHSPVRKMIQAFNRYYGKEVRI